MAICFSAGEQHITNTKTVPAFKQFGQNEPPTVRIKNIISQYVGDTGGGIGIEEIFKEMIQNADDATATQIHFILDKRHLPTYRVWDEWRPLQGPSLCIYNNAIFSENDIQAIQKLGVGSKASDPDKTGQFGIGFNVVYQITDCPSFLSDGQHLCMFDPHMRYVPGATLERPGGHTNLLSDVTFSKTWGDVFHGYLKGFIPQEGGTIFRLPFRQQNADSLISSMYYTEYSIKQMEGELQTMDFKMLVHQCLLFTKNIDNICASVIEKDGNMRNIIDIKRQVNPQMKRDLMVASAKLSTQLRDLIANKIMLTRLTRTSVTYKLVTKDEYNSCQWIVNQTFGFQGSFSEQDSKFLNEFLCGDVSGKKFSPIAGVAARIGTSTKGTSAFCFLKLPIQTGLPVHVNGHFAIYSSRRSLWTNTAFGQWNAVLARQVIVPSYCSFLRSASKACTIKNVTTWYLTLFPDPSHTNESYYNDIAKEVFNYMISEELALVPVIRVSVTSKETPPRLEFHSPNRVYFLHGPRNLQVERLLLTLGYNVCTFIEVSAKFLFAKIKGLPFMSPMTVRECLCQSAKSMNLPQNVGTTPLKTPENVHVLLDYLMQGDSGADYQTLQDVPLFLTSDNQLQKFKRSCPAFLSINFKELLPNRKSMFLHQSIADLFNVRNTNNNTPVRKLTLHDISANIKPEDEFIHDIQWVKLMWQFLKANIDRINVRGQLYIIDKLPILPGSNGTFYRLCDGNHLVDISKASKDIQKIMAKMQLPSLDAKVVATEDLLEQEVIDIAKSLVLDASRPEDVLHMLSIHHSRAADFTSEECESLLHYFQAAQHTIRVSQTFMETVRELPIFETVEGDFRSLGSTAVILDDTIPFQGVGNWIQKSNCILLIEKKAFKELYRFLGLVKKNTVFVYIDHVFPHFKEFDEDLRQSHLECIRDTVLPMVSSFATEMARRMFGMELKKLPFIKHEEQLLCANRFYNPKVEILTLLDNFLSLPEGYQASEWDEFMALAGVKQEITGKDFVTAAKKIASTMTGDMENAKKYSKIILDELFSDERDNFVYQKLSDIAFIPSDEIEIIPELLEACPRKVIKGELMKMHNAVHHEGIRPPTAKTYRSKGQKFQNWVLAWSYASILPEWVKVPEEYCDLMGVLNLVNPLMVCRHTRNLLESTTEKTEDHLSAFFQKVMLHIYKFLAGVCSCHNRLCEDCIEVNALRKTDFVVLSEGTVKTRPEKLILSFPSEVDGETLQPYVYPRPRSLSEYDELFLRLGSHKYPRPDTYATILSDIQMECTSNVMQTNQKQAASSAVFGLMMSLLLSPSKTVHVMPLFLPSEKAVMYPASELVVKDNEVLAKKYKRNDIEYLCKLTSCNLYKHPKEYLLLLPSSSRPMMLSEIVHEELIVTRSCEHRQDCPFLLEYKKRIQSETFLNALKQMAYVPFHLKEELDNNLDKLRNGNMICYATLMCRVIVKGRLAEENISYKPVYVDSQGGLCDLYLKHEEQYPGGPDTIIGVADALKSIVFDSVDSGKIEKLLRYMDKEDTVNDMLVEEDVIQHSLDECDLMVGPKPGEPIPNNELKAYQTDPGVRFVAKEFVGYLIPHSEAEKENDSSMTYAQVIRENRRADGIFSKSHLFREYVIDIGLGYHITAQATDLYKEDSLFTDEDEELHSQARVSRDQEISEAQENINKILRVVYEAPHGVQLRKKVASRFFRKWQACHVADSYVASQVTDFLMDQVSQFEAKYAYVIEDLEKERKIAAGLVDGSRTIARRWYNRSRSDLECARLMLKKNIPYEWICNTSHESVRKALISCILAHDHQTSESIPNVYAINSLMRYVFQRKDYPRTLPQEVDKLCALQTNYVDEFNPTGYKYVPPCQVYTENISREAFHLSESVVDCVEDYLEFDDINCMADENENIFDF